MRIESLPEVREYLKEVLHVLYTQEYFGFEETAIKYVEELFSDITTNLPTRPKYKAPLYFSRYGSNMYYAVFKKNSSTQWYVFFTIYDVQGEQVYLIRYITNNHVSAQYIR